MVLNAESMRTEGRVYGSVVNKRKDLKAYRK